MALVRWEPFADLLRVQGDLSRVFDAPPWRRSRERALDAAWAPAVDIFEDPDRFVIKAELPEIDPANVELRVEHRTLTLSGERTLERAEDQECYHSIERYYGRFSRSFSLPDTIEVDRIKAEARNGVLRIELPKRAEVKPRAIEVNAS